MHNDANSLQEEKRRRRKKLMKKSLAQIPPRFSVQRGDERCAE